MAEPTKWVSVLPSACRNSMGQLCSDGEDIYTVDDVAGNGATIVPDPTNRPKIVVQGGRKRIFFPSASSFFTVTFPATRIFSQVSHCFGFEQPSVTQILATNFNCLLATSVATAGAFWRVTPSSSASVGTQGGRLLVNSAGSSASQLKWQAGIFSHGGGRIHCCNICTIRYVTAGTTIRSYVNSTDAEVSNTTALGSVAHGVYYIGKHHSTASNMLNGYLDFWHIYDLQMSGTEALDAYTTNRAANPFFIGVDPAQPFLVMIGDSTTFGFTTGTDSTWWKEGFITNAVANFGDEPQWFVLGNPGVGFGVMNQQVWDYLVKPDIDPSQVGLVLYQRGAKNAIRTGGLSAAQCYTQCLACYTDFITAFPTGTYVTDTTNPAIDSNTTLEAYDTLIRAQFTDFWAAPHIYSAQSGSAFPGGYLFDIRAETDMIGGLGNNTTGVAANWTNTPPNYPTTPNNVHYGYVSDGLHMGGTDTTGRGQGVYMDQQIPLWQVLLAPIVYSSGSFPDSMGSGYGARGFLRGL